LTDTRLNEGFVFNENHTPMTPADAAVFNLASDMLIFPNVSASIISAGGHRGHIAHFAREKCGGRPAVAWAADMDHDHVVAALRSVAEGLAG
jgi:hypothetical protein